MHYTTEPRKYVKGYGFLSFVTNLSNKLRDSATAKSTTDAIKTASESAINSRSNWWFNW